MSRERETASTVKIYKGGLAHIPDLKLDTVVVDSESSIRNRELAADELLSVAEEVSVFLGREDGCRSVDENVSLPKKTVIEYKVTR